MNAPFQTQPQTAWSTRPPHSMAGEAHPIITRVSWQGSVTRYGSHSSAGWASRELCWSAAPVRASPLRDKCILLRFSSIWLSLVSDTCNNSHFPCRPSTHTHDFVCKKLCMYPCKYVYMHARTKVYKYLFLLFLSTFFYLHVQTSILFVVSFHFSSFVCHLTLFKITILFPVCFTIDFPSLPLCLSHTSYPQATLVDLFLAAQSFSSVFSVLFQMFLPSFSPFLIVFHYLINFYRFIHSFFFLKGTK